MCNQPSSIALSQDTHCDWETALEHLEQWGGNKEKEDTAGWFLMKLPMNTQ